MQKRSKRELSAIEAARRLGVGLDYLYSLLWTGKLAGRKVEKVWRVPTKAIEARLRNVR
jgi:excisionase family DNA binding protein